MPSRQGPIQDLLRGKTKERSKKAELAVKEQPTVVEGTERPVSVLWIKPLLDKALESSQVLWEPPKKSFRGSATGTRCVRALTFEALGHQVPKEARVLRIFATGKRIEDTIIQTAKEAKILVDKSDQLGGSYTDPPITCHIDGEVEQPGSGLVFLLEIKSINTYGFSNLPKEHDIELAGRSPLMARYERYVTQWNTYAWAPEIDLEYGALLFEDKNDQRQKIYGLRRDSTLRDEMLERHLEAAPYVLSDPQRVAPVPEGLDPEAGKGECSTCPHRYLCKRVPRGSVEYDVLRKEDAKLRG